MTDATAHHPPAPASPTSPAPTTPLLGVHLIGIGVMVGCFALGLWVALRMHAEVGGMIIAAGAWLYGKMGFKPVGPILDRIVAKLAEVDPVRVARLTTRPPAAPTAALADHPPGKVYTCECCAFDVNGFNPPDVHGDPDAYCASCGHPRRAHAPRPWPSHEAAS